MSPRGQGLGVELTYEERGAGEPVLLVHGIADRAEGWRDVAEAVSGHARVITYDRRGYGESGAPEPYERTTAEEQAEDAAALLAGLEAGPAVVCGRDLGALVALDLVRRHPARVRAVALVDPALYQLVGDATEALSGERLALEQALRDGGPAAAVASWLTARGAPADRIARAREDYRAFFADYAGLATLSVTRRDLRELGVPAAVLASAGAPGYVRATAAALAELVGVPVQDESELVATLGRLSVS
jgi:pimeloyl-ACP methyl ester carboxylesterase